MPATGAAPPAHFADAAAAADPSGAPPDAARLEWLWSEYEKQMAEQKQYQDEGMDIYPTPGLVAKSLLISGPTRPSPQFPTLSPAQQSGAEKMKLFVNLCSDPAIALPAMMHDGQGGEQLRVPISAGPVVLDVEKDGVTPCLVCDVVLNPDTVARAGREKDFRAFISGFALQKLQEKYKCQLEVEDIKFPKMRFKGPTPPAAQHIRRPKGAHIEPENPHADDPAQASDERLDERRRAAQLARIEALRALEERESGIVMGSSSGSGSRASAGDVFTSAEAAEAAMAADQSRSPVDRFAASKEPAKIEVLPDEPAPPRAQQPPAAPAASAAAAAASTAATPVAAAAASAATAAPATAPTAVPAPSSDPSLPSHSICYLKHNSSSDGSDTGGGTGVPASEWDLDLDPPAAVQVHVRLPLVSKSSAELEVEITRLGVMLYSKPECADKHKYQLHMQFPFLIDEERSECKFSKKTHTLTLTLPVTEKKPLPDDDTIAIEELDAPAAAAPAPAAPAIDWQEKLGLTNTLMYQLVSEC